MILFSLPNYKYFKERILKISKFDNGVSQINRYANGELYSTISTNVKNKKCGIIGGTHFPDNNLLSLLVLAHALKKEGAREVVAIVPYLGYSRQDKKETGKSLTIQWLGEVMKASGIDKIVCVDIHSERDQELFSIPLISLSQEKLFLEIGKKIKNKNISLVAPDEGAIDNCEVMKKALKIPSDIAYFKKKRTSKGVIVSNLNGEVGERVFLVDDILDTGETLISCVKKLKNIGTKEINIIITHGLFTGDKWKKLLELGVKKIYCSNTLPFLVKQKEIEVIKIEEIFVNYLKKNY